MEPRTVDLQAQLEGMRRDMDVIRQNVKTIKHRLAYLAGEPWWYSACWPGSPTVVSSRS